MIIEDEDYAYETNRQRRIDWTDAEEEAAKELSFRQDQQLKEIESDQTISPHARHGRRAR